MQIPLADVGEIIGVRGENVELIRSVSGAVVVLEKIGNGQEVRVMIEGTPSQVQTAHQLVQVISQPIARLASYSPTWSLS
jgi:poly(rC)-binding protein 3/4